jgi:hypothetical protein
VKEIMNLAFETSLFTLQSYFLHAIKSYNTGPDGFASPLKEGMQRVFIALKNPLPWPNLNTQTLGLVVSMLTIMSLRRQHNGEHHVL